MNILLCTLGASWAVVPEAYALVEPDFQLYAEHPQRDEIERLRQDHLLKPPDEIWVCTTEGETTIANIEKLQDWWKVLDTQKTLRIWIAQGTNNLATQQECERFRELSFRLALHASHECQDGQLVLSLAGGRKTMSADLQRAASLFGCHRLLHVVGTEPLPQSLRELSPENFSKPLPVAISKHIMPLIVGQGGRNDLLDVSFDNSPAINVSVYPLSRAESLQPLVWSCPARGLLHQEIDRRERQSGALLGNYLASISRDEPHENWRQLYRLPTGIINHLRTTQVDRDWLDTLPKLDLHRHLGGCLGLEQQQQVAAAVWAAMSLQARQKALAVVQPLLHQHVWDWDWPQRLCAGPNEPGRLRSERAAALLLHANTAQLQQHLWGDTEPRCALVRRHPAGFVAYERPGELSGSAILQHEAAIEAYAEAIVRQAVAENLAYLELRGSPQKYLGGDNRSFLRQLQVALDRALSRLAEGRRPIIRFIVIIDRRSQADQIRSTVELAVAAQPDGFVVGLDLAGDERHDPAEMEQWFAPAFAECLPITIHAGEGQSADNIWRAAYHLHADRIGHGLTLLDNEPLIRRFRDRGICLELCPSSNREVVGFQDPQYLDTESLAAYPLQPLWRSGLALTLCTDNPGISRTDLSGEYLAAARMCGGLTRWEALALLKQGFSHAFLGSSERGDLMKQVDTELYQGLL